MQDGAYHVFAENVRRLSLASGSLAEVCRKTAINRQQFNKYLSGAALPSKKVLQKLAAHFGVPEIELFQVHVSTPDKTDENAVDVALVKSVLRHAKTRPDYDSLPCGMYRLYTKWQPDPRLYFVFSIQIFEHAGVNCCHWHYSFKGDPTRSEKQTGMWVRGLVYQDIGKISLAGKITYPKCPGLIMLHVDFDDRRANGIWAGIVNVFLPSNIPFAGGVLLEKLPDDVSPRAVYRTNGVLKESNPTVPDNIKKLLNEKPRSNANHLPAIDLVQQWRPAVESD